LPKILEYDELKTHAHNLAQLNFFAGSLTISQL